MKLFSRNKEKNRWGGGGGEVGSGFNKINKFPKMEPSHNLEKKVTLCYFNLKKSIWSGGWL